MTRTTTLWVSIILLLVVATVATAIFIMLRRIARRNRNIDESQGLWDARDYVCPQCQEPMEQGYTLMGRGIIWSPRAGKRIGSFAHIGQTLANTMSLSLPPAFNMAWHCGQCQITVVDHSRLIRRSKWSPPTR